MGHRHDFWEKLRQWLVPRLSSIIPGGHCCERQTSMNQLVDTVALSEEELEVVLHSLEFVRNPLSHWKRVGDHGETGSWAWRGAVEVDEDGEHSFDRDPLADGQIHIILFELDGDSGTTAVYAHWEYSWLTHPIRHYRGDPLPGNGQEYAAKILSKKLDINHD